MSDPLSALMAVTRLIAAAIAHMRSSARLRPGPGPWPAARVGCCMGRGGREGGEGAAAVLGVSCVRCGVRVVCGGGGDSISRGARSSAAAPRPHLRVRSPGVTHANHRRTRRNTEHARTGHNASKNRSKRTIIMPDEQRDTSATHCMLVRSAVDVPACLRRRSLQAPRGFPARRRGVCMCDERRRTQSDQPTAHVRCVACMVRVRAERRGQRRRGTSCESKDRKAWLCCVCARSNRDR